MQDSQGQSAETPPPNKEEKPLFHQPGHQIGALPCDAYLGAAVPAPSNRGNNHTNTNKTFATEPGT